MADKVARFQIDADITPYQSAMAQAVAATTEAVEGIKSSFSALNETFASVSDDVLGPFA